VPSSTSSSEPRKIPRGDWRATWLVALVAAIAAVWAVERTTRAHGQRPSVTDDAVWWSVARRSADGDAKVVAFVGTSRMELAYSPEAFAEAAPDRRGVQLAIDGIPALGVLADLAADDDFRGTAVVDVSEWDVVRDDAFTGATAYVDRSHALWRAPGALANRALASLAQERLAVLAVGGRELLAAWGARRWPEPKWVMMERDRSFHADDSLAPPAALQKRRDKGLHGFPASAPDPATWLAQVSRIAPLVAQIRARGGDVAFVRLPITGELAKLAEQRFPRARYWDRFAALPWVRAIHSADVPALAGIECPDFMHVDQKDQAVLTRTLVAALRDRGVLR
jgi:hypothetical protein